MNPSGQAPPTSISGWERIFVDDFDTPVARGKFIGALTYSPRWTAYRTGTRTTPPWRTGVYDNSILEVDNSCLILNVCTIDGIPRTAALLPKLTAVAPYGVMGLRQMIRFRILKPLPGYKLAWLLWPDSKVWPRDGEIDFPECSIDGHDTIKGFMHRQDATQGSDQAACNSNVVATGDWHTATIVWKSGEWRTAVCEFILDGTRVGRWTSRVPNGPMHSVIQTEPDLDYTKPAATVAGRIEIDWYAAFRPK